MKRDTQIQMKTAAERLLYITVISNQNVKATSTDKQIKYILFHTC